MLQRSLTTVEKLVSWASGGLLFFLMLLTFADVCGRNLFGRPIEGATEVTEIVMAGIVFLMLPVISFRNEHIVIDLIDGITGRKGRLILDIISALFGAATFVVMGVQMWISAAQASKFVDKTPALQIPLAPIFYLIALLMFITGIAFLLTIYTAIFHPPADAKASDATTII